MRKLRTPLILLGIVFFVCRAIVFSPAAVAPAPSMPLSLPGTIEGIGTDFVLTDSEYLNVSLHSVRFIKVKLASFPKTVTIDIGRDADGGSTTLTVSGLRPETTYHKYQDNLHAHEVITTDRDGRYLFSQDLGAPHLIIVQAVPSTIFLSDSGWSDPTVGTWDPGTRTATMTRDVTETIQIDNNTITLDGAGHSLTGSGAGSGIYMNGRRAVLIRNVNVSRFSYGVYLRSAVGNTVSGARVSRSSFGVALLSGSRRNTIADSTVTTTSYALLLHYSHDNTVSANNLTANQFAGVALIGSGENRIADNVIADNPTGIGANGGHDNVLSGNTLSGHQLALDLYHYSSDNTVTLNNIADNTAGIEVSYWSDNNKVFSNNFLNNGLQASVDTNSVNNVFNLAAPVGGNHWSDWTTPDADADGFVDAPYVFTGGQDDLPLAAAGGWMDKAAPQTLAQPAGDTGQNGWYASDVQLSLSAQDPGSGVSAIQYSFDGVNFMTYSTPLTLSVEGIYTIYYYAIDNNGNAESVRTLRVKIDKTAPEAIIGFDPITGSLVVSGQDALSSAVNVSGLQGRFRVASVFPSTFRPQANEWVLTDEAGHTARVRAEVRARAGRVTTKLTNIIYDDGSSLKPGRNRLETKWSLTAGGELKSLTQAVEVVGDFAIRTSYRKSLGSTTVIIRKVGSPRRKMVMTGVATVALVTDHGRIAYAIKRR